MLGLTSKAGNWNDDGAAAFVGAGNWSATGGAAPLPPGGDAGYAGPGTAWSGPGGQWEGGSGPGAPGTRHQAGIIVRNRLRPTIGMRPRPLPQPPPSYVLDPGGLTPPPAVVIGPTPHAPTPPVVPSGTTTIYDGGTGYTMPPPPLDGSAPADSGLPFGLSPLTLGLIALGLVFAFRGRS